MKQIDLTYIIPIILLLFSGGIVLLYGRRKISNESPIKMLKYIPFASVIALLFGVLYITNYYQKLLEVEQTKFAELQSKNYYSDSVVLDNRTKAKALDSLNSLNKEFERILLSIIKQEKITGDQTLIKQNLLASITKTKNEIGTIGLYNEIIPVPKYLDGGYMTSGNTSNFIFSCPTDKGSEYIDLTMKFQDESLINKIDCILLEITEIKPNGQYWRIFSQAYKPRKNINIIKIKNYMKSNNIVLDLGYILKSETSKKYPTFEKISCRSN